MTKLPYLKTINLRGAVWVSRDVAERIIKASKVQVLENVDFRECGMYRERKWTIAGPIYEIWRRIEEEKAEEAEKVRKEREEQAKRRRMAGLR